MKKSIKIGLLVILGVILLGVFASIGWKALHLAIGLAGFFMVFLGFIPGVLVGFIWGRFSKKDDTKI